MLSCSKTLKHSLTIFVQFRELKGQKWPLKLPVFMDLKDIGNILYFGASTYFYVFTILFLTRNKLLIS
jgi:hypothetical protein